jgi:hypothetical protein
MVNRHMSGDSPYSPQIPELTPASMKDQSTLRRLTDYLRGLVLVSPDGSVSISRQASVGTSLTVNAEGGAGGGAAGGSTYAGLFACTKKNDTQVTIAAGKYIKGTTTVSVALSDITISATGTVYVYINITAAGNSYSSNTSYPAQATDTLRVLIATLTVAVGPVIGAIQQQQFGEIHVAGRIV